MDQILFYNLEKNNVRLSIMGGTSYENAINSCQEFIARLNEHMAAQIAQQDLAAAKESEVVPQEISDGSN